MKILTNILLSLLMAHTAHGLVTGSPLMPPESWTPWIYAFGTALVLWLWLWLGEHTKEIVGIILDIAPPPPKAWAVGVAGLVLAVPFFGDYLFPIAGFARPWEWASLLFWALFTVVAAYAIAPPWKTTRHAS
jgi:hypothetical protein